MKGEANGSQVWARALIISVLRSLGHEDSEPEVSLDHIGSMRPAWAMYVVKGINS